MHGRMELTQVSDISIMIKDQIFIRRRLFILGNLYALGIGHTANSTLKLL
jgi:hypothetical protein